MVLFKRKQYANEYFTDLFVNSADINHYELYLIKYILFQLVPVDIFNRSNYILILFFSIIPKKKKQFS